MKTAVNLVQKYFPGVKEVRDAEQELPIEVISTDVTSAQRKQHASCAFAVACKRTFNLEGVLISRSIAYLVLGESAVRFQVPDKLRTETIHFDKSGSFNLGTYTLLRVNRAHKLGKGHRKEGFISSYGPRKHKRTVLSDVRAVL